MRAGLQHWLQGNWRGRAAAMVVGIWALGACGAAAQSELSEAQARERLENLRAGMEAIQGRLKEQRSRRGAAEKRIENLDREIAWLAEDIRRTERGQARIRERIDRLSHRLGEIRQRLAAQRERMARLAYSAYVMGRQNQLKLLLNQQDPEEINRILGYHDYIVEARAQTIERINGWAAEVAALSKEQKERQNELTVLKNEFRSKQDALRARRKEREAALAAVNVRIVSSEDELSRLKENENQLKEVLRELREYLAKQSSRRMVGGAFRSMKGKLRLPVSAPIAVGFGEPRATGVRWDGLMFRPERGAQVMAIFEGRVVFADWLRGFGLLLIIDHGDGFMSLYSHNESLFKQLGDWVDTEEVIAEVGTSGGLDRPGLYFEIRYDGEPQNPLSWCQRA